MSHLAPQYGLGIDGGGTKTLARLFRTDAPEPPWEARGGAASLTNDLDGTVEVIQALVAQLLSQAGVEPEQVSMLAGVAGAGNPERRDALHTALSARYDFAQLAITTDARTSLYGAGQGEPVVCVALGTGSVAMTLDRDGSERQCGGWGATFGDEGGASQLGKAAIKATLKELDGSGEAHSGLARAVADQIGHSRAEILPKLATFTPAALGQLAPLVSGHAEHCPVARDIMAWHAEQVESLIALAQPESPLPVVLTGGLVEATLPYLGNTLQEQLQRARGTALDGACLLAQRLAQPNC